MKMTHFYRSFARILALFFAALFCFASCAQRVEPAVKPDVPQEQTPAPVEEPARLSEEQRDELILALSTRLIPCMQENCTVRAVYREEAGRVLVLVRSLSPKVAFTFDGAFSRKKP